MENFRTALDLLIQGYLKLEGDTKENIARIVEELETTAGDWEDVAQDQD